MPIKASTSGRSLGRSSRKRCGRQPETMRPWAGLVWERTSADSRMASMLSSCAASIKEQVFTMTTSAWRASLVISSPLLSRDPSIISASTRFLAQPREINPTRTGAFLVFVVTGIGYGEGGKTQPRSARLKGGRRTGGTPDGDPAVGARPFTRYAKQRHPSQRQRPIYKGDRQTVFLNLRFTICGLRFADRMDWAG